MAAIDKYLSSRIWLSLMAWTWTSHIDSSKTQVSHVDGRPGICGHRHRVRITGERDVNHMAFQYSIQYSWERRALL